MFGNCQMAGKFPASMLSGLGKLTNISYCFCENKFTEGTLPSTFLDECPNIIDANNTFQNSSISGELPSGFFKNQSKLTKAYSMFYASDLTSVGKDALSGLTADKLMLNVMFRQTNKLRCDIPEGFFTHLTGDNVWATQMFYNSYVNSVPSTLFDEISHFENCAEMFAYCTQLNSPCPAFPSNGDFDSYETIQKYFGIFAKNVYMADFDTIPAELGGHGERLFPKYNVGKICLDDGTFVEIKDFVYDTNNKPIGFCFHSDDNVNKVMAWNDFYGTITNSASTLTQFFYPYDEIPWPYTYSTLGTYPLSSDAWNYTTEKTSAEYTQDLFNWQKYKDNRDVLDGYRFVEEYKAGEHNNYFWHIPNIHEAMEMSMLYAWMYEAVLKLRNSTNGDYNTSNCYYVRVSIATCSVLGENQCYVTYNYGAIVGHRSLSGNMNSVRPIIDIPQK